MRVIAGKFKGKILTEFELSSTRPTADMVREALFDKIGFLVDDSVFLDLFAGTGAVGIEAISRGAKFCHFVDLDKSAQKIIEKNLKSVNATNCEILNCDYLSALKKFENNCNKFDIIFIDPPYKTDFAETAIEYIFQNNLLAKNGLCVWEHDDSKLDYIAKTYGDVKTKKYGKKYLTYIQKYE